MAKESTYPVDSLVKIKDPGNKPGNWNWDMMALIGAHSYITASSSPHPRRPYRYHLADWEWTWRHEDLELLKLPGLDPNAAFRNRKI